MVRPILNRWHPGTGKITYWFPTLFCLGLFGAIGLLFFGLVAPIITYLLYFGLLFVHSLMINKNVTVALLSLVAVLIQFTGYGLGFLRNTLLMAISNKKPQELFPRLFFKTE